MSSKVPAAASTLRILTFLASRTRPVPASRIASELGIPRSSTYDILAELLDQGFVLHYADLHAYGLGPSAYELSFGYSRQAPVARLGKRVADMVRARVGESVHVAVLQGRHVLYVVQAPVGRALSPATDAGVRLPAHLTASGRAILGALPPQQLGVVFTGEHELESTVHTDADEQSQVFPVARALADARETRERGFALEDGSVTRGLRSVALPVFDGARWPIASIAVTWHATDGARDQDMLAALRDGVKALQTALS
ncbi:MAG: IclR family transcriptional regulator [Dermabacter sp.]|nr:IclR family transcriptional regulator [Dermabacter sp.]